MLKSLNFLKIIIIFIFLIFTSVTLCTIFSTISFAESNQVNWSWTTAESTVYSSISIDGDISSLCPNVRQMRQISGVLGQKNVCISIGDSANLGFAQLPFYGYTPLVSFRYDEKMHILNGICGRGEGCLYIPNSDILVTRQHIINSIVESLIIYKNFSKRLHPLVNGVFVEYYFDKSEPDYIFQNSNGYAWPVGGVGSSKNGKWLGIEVRQRGIMMLDLESFKIKRISDLYYGYNVGSDPISEISVSDSGGNLAIMGQNSGLFIIDNVDSCGDIPTEEMIDDVKLIKKPCDITQIDSGTFIDRFNFAQLPNFSEDGGEISFYANSYSGEIREVILRAQNYGGGRLDYLALGDSFSSGEGETEDRYYINGTNDKYEKCHVSTRSYPFLVAKFSSIDPVYVKNIACSGARTIDINSSGDTYHGQGSRLNNDQTKLIGEDENILKTQARLSFIPGRIGQSDFVRFYKPHIITVGIGGNDAGFMDKLVACLGKDTCSWAVDEEDKEQAAIEIKNLFGNLASTYQKLHNQSPTSKIFAVGYPKIIDQNGKCSLVLGKLLSDKERKFINEGVIYLNQVIESAARNVGIGYIDIQDSYGDHVLCGGNSEKAMNSISLGDDAVISENLDWLKVVGQESFHPNPLGHSIAAKSIGNILNLKYCANGEVICPSETIAPEPSSYWIPGVVHDYPVQRIANFVYNDKSSTDGLSREVLIDEFSLAPNSNVTIEITSEARFIGNFVSTENGSLNVNINLPNDLAIGYHTVRLYGTSYSGEQIELYQVIDYKIPTDSLDVVQNPTDNTKHLVSNILVNGDELESDGDAVLSYALKDILGDYDIVNKSNGRPKKDNSTKSNNSYFYVSVIFVCLTVLSLTGFYIYKKLWNNKIGRVR